ncbi:hypothetical protein ES707_09142 [subsurface metagenome]
MEMSHSEPDADSPEQSSEDLTPVEEEDSSTLEEHNLPQQIDFTRWQEGSLPARATSALGHRHVVKSRKVLRSEPVRITHDISLEPESEPESESVEITPLKEGDAIVGLLLTCGCGATHEVRFDYGGEE